RLAYRRSARECGDAPFPQDEVIEEPDEPRHERGDNENQRKIHFARSLLAALKRARVLVISCRPATRPGRPPAGFRRLRAASSAACRPSASRAISACE